MLTKFDDYPIHQTAEPIAHPASSDRNVYDRYWYNGYANDGEFYFAVGMGLYPNRGILDCGFGIVRDGGQHAFHASKRAAGEPTDTTVGPFRIEVVEPMMVSRVVLEPNETGMECDLTFTARTACVEEGRQTLRQGFRPMLDSTRFAQFGRWQGTVQYNGKTVAVDASRVYGTKDRSWGLRPVGEPESGGAPARRLPQVYFLWAPIHWQDHCTHFGTFEDESGYPIHQDGAIVPAYGSLAEIPGVMDPGIRAMASVEHEITYVPGTRRAKSARITLVERSGERRETELEPLIAFRMKGIGYTHPEWGHGRWKGELAIGGESWKTAALNELALENIHVQQVMRARSQGQEGVGVLEQICLGPHAPSGFREFMDGAA
ncbi:MAG TPA: hypothetical protein VJL07_05620 [Dehalococcoidia bacterium]|nr:hypothetical protein [Dehalococcoidia bacterium]